MRLHSLVFVTCCTVSAQVSRLTLRTSSLSWREANTLPVSEQITNSSLQEDGRASPEKLASSLGLQALHTIGGRVLRQGLSTVAGPPHQ